MGGSVKPKVLAIGVSGPRCAPRFHITDTAGRFWSGCGWSEDHRQAALFHDSNTVADVLHQLMVSEVPGPLLTFSMPLLIEAKSHEPLDLEALQQWLARAVQISINAEHGAGPTPESMVMIRLDFGQLKENQP